VPAVAHAPRAVENGPTSLPLWHDAAVQIVLAMAALRLGQLNDARTRLSDSPPALERMPDAVVLHEWHRETHEQADAFAARGAAAGVSLTPAEVKLLRFLPSHLSFKEIARLANITPNTVKSHANSIYRKLGVACRSEAVAQARGCGLLGD
jgi:LuxR family maltose regulon positive regulatory protein